MDKQKLILQFAQNLEITREELGLTQKEMADELEISLSAYKSLISGTTQKIDVFILVKLYEMTGKLAFQHLGQEHDEKMRIISKLNGLSEQQLIYINAIAEFEQRFRAEYTDVDDYISVFIPTGNVEDGMIYDSSMVEKINISQYEKKYRNQIHYGIKITSNHLHPAYNKGDILLISKAPIRDGDIGIFVNKENGCAYIRKFLQTNPCQLVPINDYGVTFYVNSEDIEDMNKWVKFGKVITKVR